MKLFRRFNPKHEVWPGGPQIGQVIEAQLSPAATPAGVGPAAAAGAEAPEDDDTTAVDLLLLLRS